MPGRSPSADAPQLRIRLDDRTAVISVDASARVVAAIDDALGDLIVAPDRSGGDEASAPDPVAVIVTSERRIDGALMFTVKVGDLPQWRTDEPAAVVDHIVTSLTRLTLDNRADALHLHAGLVCTPEGSVLITGPSGSGKSTITAAALAGGFAYATDEMVAIDLDSGSVTGLLKPLTIKGDTWGRHRDVLGDEPPAGDRWSVRASKLGELADPMLPPVVVVLFPTFTPDGAFTVQEVSAASAAVRLVGETLDLGRAGSAGFARLVAVVSGALSVDVAYADADEVIDWLRDVVAAPRGAVEVEAVPPVHPAGGAIGRSPSVQSFVLNGKAALYDEKRGHAAELDAAASVWWQALDGIRTPLHIAEDIAAAAECDRTPIESAGLRLISELESSGFVT